MPILEQLHKNFKGTVRFVGIAQDLNSGENRRAVKELVTAAKVSMPQFLESDGPTVEERFFGKQVTSLPAFALFDTEGLLRMGLIGSLANQENHDVLMEELRKLTLEVASQKKTKSGVQPR